MPANCPNEATGHRIRPRRNPGGDEVANLSKRGRPFTGRDELWPFHLEEKSAFLVWVAGGVELGDAALSARAGDFHFVDVGQGQSRNVSLMVFEPSARVGHVGVIRSWT